MGIRDVKDEKDYNQLEDAPPFLVYVDPSILLANEDASYFRLIIMKGRVVKKKCNFKKQ
jgi:hypothetical protein